MIHELDHNILGIVKDLPEIIQTYISNKIYDYRQRNMYKEINDKPKIQTKIFNFTNECIPQEVMALLNKGPNFIPTTTIKLYDIKNNIKDAGITLIAKNFSIQKQRNFTQFSTQISKLPTHQATFCYNSLDELSATLDNIQTDLIDPKLANINMRSFTLTKELAQEPHLVVGTADKNLGFTINSIDWYIQEYNRQLSNNNTYGKITTPFNELCLQGLETLRSIGIKFQEYLTNERFLFLTSRKIDNITLPSLNINPKVHKLKDLPSPDNETILQARPIINGYASINVEPSRILAQEIECILAQLHELYETLGLPDTILNNSDHLIDCIKHLNFNFEEKLNLWIVSFDFSSLYTNVERGLLLENINRLNGFFDINPTQISLIENLSQFLALNNFFHVGFNDIYVQKEGLSMGGYDSVSTCNLILKACEMGILCDPIIGEHLLLCKRYIDDGFCLIKGTFEDVLNTVILITNYYPSQIPLKWKINKFSENFLDITTNLNINNNNNNLLSYHIYQKPFNTYSYPHYTSNHPRHVLHGIITGECHRYRSKSHNENEYQHIIKLFIVRLKKAGYPSKIISNFILPYSLPFRIGRNERTGNKLYIPSKFDKRIKKDQLIKNIIKKYTRPQTQIVISNKCGKKLKTFLLTKKELHKKIQRRRTTLE